MIQACEKFVILFDLKCNAWKLVKVLKTNPNIRAPKICVVNGTRNGKFHQNKSREKAQEA